MDVILCIFSIIALGFLVYKMFKIQEEERKLITKREHLLIDALNKYLKGE